MRASLLVAVAGLALAQVPKPEKILVTRVFPQPGQIGLFLVAPDGSNENPLVTPTDIDCDACSVGLHAIQIRGAVGRRHTSLVAGKISDTLNVIAWTLQSMRTMIRMMGKRECWSILLPQILERRIESAVALSHNARPRRRVPNRDM